MKDGTMDGERRIVILPSSAPRAVEWAAERLVSGGVIAIPTDTVYGIAASLSHDEAIERVFEIKGRPVVKPLPVLVSSTDTLVHIATELAPDVALLLDRFWPGPLTVAIPARAGMPRYVTACDGTVGVRMPNHPLAIEVIAKAGGAVACTSANLSGKPPSSTADEVVNVLGSRLDLVLDGGRTPGGVASTVVAFDGDDLRVLREGAIPIEILRTAWTELRSAR